MIRLGYPTQNLTIQASTNRTLRLASLVDAERVKGLVRENIADLKRILRWNAEHGVGLFRMGQNLPPSPLTRRFLTTGRPSTVRLAPMGVEIV